MLSCYDYNFLFSWSLREFEKCWVEDLWISWNFLKIWLTIHFSHSFNEVTRFFKAHKTISFCFVCFLFSNNFSFLKWWVFGESSCKRFIGHFITKITNEDTEVIYIRTKPATLTWEIAMKILAKIDVTQNVTRFVFVLELTNSSLSFDACLMY